MPARVGLLAGSRAVSHTSAPKAQDGPLAAPVLSIVRLLTLLLLLGMMGTTRGGPLELGSASGAILGVLNVNDVEELGAYLPVKIPNRWEPDAEFWVGKEAIVVASEAPNDPLASCRL
ncbi:hypothetical protein B0H13DRAFT_2303361 [Mycena leptocephala]|nr:hypothetical protein B0H13DRAFT_2303361 [Mycena leptocephala]